MNLIEKMVWALIGIIVITLPLLIINGGLDFSMPNCFNTKITEMPTYCLLLLKF